jgi:predicted transposase/invertase (TIGR01784 family)
MKYLDPKNDLVFKRVFSDVDVLRSFLNALLPLGAGQEVAELEYLSPENVPDTPLRKFSIVDVRCRDNYGRHFIVEMQMSWSSNFDRRMLYNVSSAYSRQLGFGQSYGMLQPVYGLGILNDVFDRDSAEYYHRYRLRDENGSGVIDGLEILLVELPKFKAESAVSKRMAVLWLRFLRELRDGVGEVSAELLADADVSRAVGMCEVGAYSAAEFYAYERYWASISNELGELEAKYAEGLQHGISEGEALGRAEGRMEGEALGRAEGAQERQRLQQEQQKLQQELAASEQERQELLAMIEKLTKNK